LEIFGLITELDEFQGARQLPFELYKGWALTIFGQLIQNQLLNHGAREFI